MKKRKKIIEEGKIKIDPNEKVKNELSDDDAYKLKVPLSEMEKRRIKLGKKKKK